MTDTNKSTYAPFTLLDTGEHCSLLLSDDHMMAKVHVFEELGDEGWSGNGYDWNSIAQVVVSEELPDLAEQLEFDPEAGMFCALGPRDALEQLGAAMASAYNSEERLRDLLSRAEFD